MKKNLICLLIACIMILSPIASVSVYAEETEGVEKTDAKDKDESVFDFEKFSNETDFLKIIIPYILNDYIYEVDDKDVVDNLYKGFFNALDKYSVYYTAEEYAKFNTTMSGEFVGVGVHMMKKDYGIEVISTIEGSPAEKAGLKSNDVFIKVGDINVENYSLDDIAKLLRGEAGTSVDVQIKRDDKFLEFTLNREKIVITSISSRIINDDIAYIKISEFKANTDELFKEELDKFDEKNINKIIIDVRNNPGGSVNTVLRILNNFVSEKPLLIEKRANDTEITYTSEKNDKKYNLCVLVNKDSASASEILAGAIQDNGAGKIIGDVTFGKGVVQKVIQLMDGSAIKYTCAEYFTPNRNKVQGIGIVPDIEVSQDLLHGDINLEEIPELTQKREAKMGAVGLDVLGAEMILDILGYDISNVDGVLDDDTYYEIARYQMDNGLYGHGILDKETQSYLTKALEDYVNQEKDTQLERAIEELGK